MDLENSQNLVLYLYVVVVISFCTVLGMFYAFSSLGPALGYILGGQLLDVYVDYPKPPPRFVLATLVNIYILCMFYSTTWTVTMYM